MYVIDNHFRKSEARPFPPKSSGTGMFRFFFHETGGTVLQFQVADITMVYHTDMAVYEL